MTAPAAASTSPTILLALEHGPWEDVQAGLRQACALRRIDDLAPPAIRILHDLLDKVLRQMHLKVFRRIMEMEVGLPFEGGEAQLEPLYDSELSEHGIQNIANACRLEGWQVLVRFPPMDTASAELVQIEMPFRLDRLPPHLDKLIEALGCRLDIEPCGSGCRILLALQTSPALQPQLLTPGDDLASIGRICARLAYGVIRFSAAGEILAASPSMLSCLHLEPAAESLDALAALIPADFRNDVIWGLVLNDSRGNFENYRIRLHSPGASELSILFNVSGFRDDDGTIHSLWQVVSQAGGGQLAQGAILSEVRVHNITRNYVPQLVENKAREAVRLGKAGLVNEERHIAVLFCDIVGFTAYVESNASKESTIETLNTILRRVSVSVKHNRGAIDKFMGDCIMALFDDPADAVRAAIDMQSHSEDINSLRSGSGQQILQLRIGIHWGEVVIGNVGTAERLDWTAIGDVVNTASRIEKGCVPGGILVSQALREAVEAGQRGAFSFGEVFGLQVKGKRDALPVCKVDAS